MADAPRDTGFYDTAYGHFSDELYAAIRQAAFGEDIGQNSWLTEDELRTFCEWLGVDTSTELLEVASGSGGPALFTVETTGCRLFGVDLHDEGVAAANRAPQERGLADRARFVCVDARKTLPVDAGSFDAVICIDSINHMYERSAVLRECRRVLRPSGRVLFTDPITVTGLLRSEEMILRGGAMGEFVFTPPAGLDQRLLEEAGFADVRAEDVTENAARVAAAWPAARERRSADLDEVDIDASKRPKPPTMSPMACRHLPLSVIRIMATATPTFFRSNRSLRRWTYDRSAGTARYMREFLTRIKASISPRCGMSVCSTMVSVIQMGVRRPRPRDLVPTPVACRHRQCDAGDRRRAGTPATVRRPGAQCPGTLRALAVDLRAVPTLAARARVWPLSWAKLQAFADAAG